MREITLTQGKVALVDDEDYERVSQHKWYARCSKHGSWYALTNTREGAARKSVLMHRFVLRLVATDPLVDHRDLDGLNNQKHNLREATYAGNTSNRPPRKDSVSGVKGVRWCGRHRKWAAQITVARKSKWLGYHATREGAAEAYAVAAREHFGEFARVDGGAA